LISFPKTQGGKFILNTNNDVRFIADGRDRQMRVFASHLQSYYDYIIDELFRYYTLTVSDLDKVSKIYSKLFPIFFEKDRRLNIFTTNYDIAIEKFFRTENIPLTDGFEYDNSKDVSVWKPDVFDKKTGSDNSHVFLFKIHGSLNWADHHQYGIIRLHDTQGLMQTGFHKQNVLIHPTLSPKEDETHEPYNILIEHFKQELSNSKVCVVIGFSFRDQAVVEAFKQFLNNGNRLIVVSPTVNEDSHKLDPDQEHVLRLSRIGKRLEESTVMEIKEDIRNCLKNEPSPSSS